MIDEEEQLLTQTEVAAQKGTSLQGLSHHLAKPGAPTPVIRYGKKLFRAADVAEWKPKIHRGKKTCHKPETP